MSERRLKVLIRSLAATGLVLFCLAIGLTIGDENTTSGDVPFIILMAVSVTAFSVMGLVIASNAPTNPIGWLCTTVGLSALFSLTVNQYAARGLSDLHLPGLGYAQWLSFVALSVAAPALIMTLLLFPTGSPPSPRWKVVGWLIALGGILMAVASALVPVTLSVGEDLEVRNPFGIASISSWTWIANAATISLLAGAVAAIVAIVVRFWRSRGDERQQMRWLAFGVSLVLFSVILMFLAGDSRLGEFTWLFFSATILVGMPGAIAIAVLKFRLYDLDLVIKKTVVFAITVVLVMVLGIGLLLAVSGPLTALAPDETSAVFAVALVIGLLAVPLWRLGRRIGDRLVYGGRVTPYEALTEFTERLSEAYATDDVLPRMAAILGESTRAAEARVWLRVGSEFRPAAAWPAAVAQGALVQGSGDSVPDLGADRTVEVRHRGELLGALSVNSKPNDPIDSGREKLMGDLAGQAGLVLRNVRLIEDLRASRQRLVAAQDQERRKLERDIHDGAQQQLVAQAVKLRLAEGLVERDPAKAREMLAQLQEDSHRTLEDLRDLARGIYPPLLADKGLVVALEGQARKGAVPITVSADGIGRYSQDVEAAVYFCALEALNNVAKYADATRASIELRQSDGHLTFSVSDDGRGFDTTVVGYGTGLQGIADRLAALGGTVAIVSSPGAGANLSGAIPVPPA